MLAESSFARSSGTPGQAGPTPFPPPGPCQARRRGPPAGREPPQPLPLRPGHGRTSSIRAQTRKSGTGSRDSRDPRARPPPALRRGRERGRPGSGRAAGPARPFPAAVLPSGARRRQRGPPALGRRIRRGRRPRTPRRRRDAAAAAGRASRAAAG